MISGYFTMNGFGQLPEIQKLYPKIFDVTSEDWVKNALATGIRADWGEAIRNFLSKDVDSGSAKVFLRSWANLAWNSYKDSANAVNINWFKGLIPGSPSALFVGAWDNANKDMRKRWDSRYPAYQALLRHLDGQLSAVPIDRATQLEVARQSIGFGRMAQDMLGFLNGTKQTIASMGNVFVQSITSFDPTLSVEVISNIANKTVNAASKIVVAAAVAAGAAVGGAAKGLKPLLNLPWWVWIAGIGAIGFFALPVIMPLVRRR
jgi:hypothetical protein